MEGLIAPEFNRTRASADSLGNCLGETQGTPSILRALARHEQPPMFMFQPGLAKETGGGCVVDPFRFKNKPRTHLGSIEKQTIPGRVLFSNT
jgi:hypothetical protein